MAQAKVSDYFGAKKRVHESHHPSKRRKLETTDLVSTPISETVVKPCTNVETTLQSSKQIGKTPRSRPKSTQTQRTRGSTRKKNALVGQATIQDALAKASSYPNVASDTPISSEIGEEHTSFWDEHDGAKTPKRKIRPHDSTEPPVSDNRGKLTARRRKSDVDSVTPKKDVTDEEKAARGRSLARSFRTMLAAASSPGRRETDHDKTAEAEIIHVAPSSPRSSPGAHTTTKGLKPMPSKQDLVELLSPVHPVPISPLPPTPQEIACGKVKAPPAVVSPKMKSSMDRMKRLQNGAGCNGDDGTGEVVAGKAEAGKSAVGSKKVITPKEMRERLAKCGKLDSLKAKLAEMNQSLKAARHREAERKALDVALPEEEVDPKEKEAGEAQDATPAQKVSPAFERYEHLAREGPPSLALPVKYQRLLTMFQGTDTVVSMLFNRQEVITFSKLQTAVQSMTKKNFEQKALGQMKTVYPDAYKFRQEKGLPNFGRKVTGYQLTMEPNLEGLAERGQRAVKDKEERPNMSAQVLLKRKRIFHNSLVNLTKDHHASFLSKLNPCIKVPASKLTRWHPRFPLDSVPDVAVARLPAPPEHKVQTAQQVLDGAKGKLPARVEEAMARVAVKSEEKNSAQPTPSTSSSGEQSKPSSAAAAKPAGSAYRGIPLSLLEKIRAKEAAKTQAALTRDPKEDRKTEMIGRLPALIRSLRTFYVTEKKPSLPFQTVVEKLADSYATSISTAEVEAHLVLLQELAPRWLQVISIARGKYVKIDKNTNIAPIIAHLNNLAKSRR